MSKEYTSLGLMSGTSGDGIDASIIRSDGISKYEVLFNKYYKYQDNIYETIHSIKEKINNTKDLKNFTKDLKNLERKITMYHVEVVSEILKKNKLDIVGFHGQTIYHNSREKISIQLGDGKLLSQLIKKDIIFNFRKNDIKNGGEGAPLTPIFHQLIATQKNIKMPVCILNIGGISNITIIKKPIGSDEIFSKDIGPGNCLIDTWIRKNSGKKYDKDGILAARGEVNEIILEQAQELYLNRIDKEKLSYDVNDFDISFARGLSLEDGAATITEFTSNILIDSIINFISTHNSKIKEIFICGGGRKNKFLINKINEKIGNKINLRIVDDYKLSGDFIESQAFAFIAIRRLLNLPVSYPNTTGCSRPNAGGDLIEN